MFKAQAMNRKAMETMGHGSDGVMVAVTPDLNSHQSTVQPYSYTTTQVRQNLVPFSPNKDPW